MTGLGQYFVKKSTSKVEINKKTGIGISKISELTLNPFTQLCVRKLYLIALALDVDSREVLKKTCKNLVFKIGI